MTEERGFHDRPGLQELLEGLLDDVVDELDRPAPETPLQTYTRQLLELCEQVIRQADERTAVAFWNILINVAARHGRRAGRWPA